LIRTNMSGTRTAVTDAPRLIRSAQPSHELAGAKQEQKPEDHLRYDDVEPDLGALLLRQVQPAGVLVVSG
jgi:hypothetical protein